MMWLIKENWIWLLLAAILGAVITWLLIIRKVAVSTVRERTVGARADVDGRDVNVPGAAVGGATLGAAGAAGSAGAAGTAGTAGTGLALDKRDADADLNADLDGPDLEKPSFGADAPSVDAPSAEADLDAPSVDADLDTPSYDADLPSGDVPEASGGLDGGDAALAGGAGLAGAGLAGATFSGGDDDLDAGVGETTRIRPVGSHRADVGDVSTPEADLAAAETDMTAPDAGADADADGGTLAGTAGLAGAAGAGAFVAGKYAGSAEPTADGSAPAGYTVKGNEGSMIYHSTESPYYGRTKAEVWFDSDSSAEAAGFRRWNAPDFLGGGAAGLAAMPAAGGYGEGSADPLEGGASPHESFTIKGNADSMKYHTTESPYYGRTVAETWFNTEEAAKGAGFVRWDDRSGDDDAPAAFAGVPEGAFGPGSADPLEDGSAPDGSFTVKGNADSMLYHTEESPYYGRTRAEAWFNSEETARAAGFTRWDER